MCVEVVFWILAEHGKRFLVLGWVPQIVASVPAEDASELQGFLIIFYLEAAVGKCRLLFALNVLR